MPNSGASAAAQKQPSPAKVPAEATEESSKAATAASTPEVTAEGGAGTAAGGSAAAIAAAKKRKKKRASKKKRNRKSYVIKDNPLEEKITPPKPDDNVSHTVLMTAEPMYPTDLPANAPKTKQVSVPRHWKQFDIKPTFWGTNIVYCNAADEKLYEYELDAPSLIVWVLIQPFKGAYVKRRIIEEAMLLNIQIKLVDPSNFDLLASRDGVDTVSYRGEHLALPDACIVRVGAVVDFFGLAVIRHLGLLGVQMFNDVNSVLVSRDKLATYQTLSANGVPVPKSVMCKPPIDVAFLAGQVGWPMIVKHPSGSQGEAVWKCANAEELERVVEEHGTSDVPLIFQQFVTTSTGRDIRAFVVGGQLIGAYMRINKGSFKSNIHQGGVGKLIRVDPELETLVLKTAELCGLHIAGVDVMMDSDDGTYKICECNSSPGFEGIERYSGINVARSIMSYVAATLALRKWNRLQHRRRIKAKQFVPTPIQSDHEYLGLDDAQREERLKKKAARVNQGGAVKAAAPAIEPIPE